MQSRAAALWPSPCSLVAGYAGSYAGAHPFFFMDQHFIRKKYLINLGRLKNQREGINTLNDPAAKRPLNLDPDLRDRNTTAHLRATSAPIEGRV